MAVIIIEDYLEDINDWCEVKKVYFVALSLRAVKTFFDESTKYLELSYFQRFAHDVLDDYFNGVDEDKLRNDLLVTKAFLNRLLTKTDEDYWFCERTQDGMFTSAALLHGIITASIRLINEAHIDILKADLGAYLIDSKILMLQSPIMDYFFNVLECDVEERLNEYENEIDQEIEWCLLEGILSPASNDKQAVADMKFRKSKSLDFSIPAVASFYESKDHKHFYINKLRKMYEAIEVTEMTEDDYIAIDWSIANWNWYAAKLFSKEKTEVACSIIFAVLTETVKAFSSGKLWERLANDQEYAHKMSHRLYESRTLFSLFLRSSDEQYLCQIYELFSSMEEDTDLPAFLQFEMSSISRAAARVLDIEY